MTTSNSYDFSLNARQIIAEALELIGELPAGENPKASDEQTCLRTLNQMIKAWQAEQIYLWKNMECTLFQTFGSYSYDIGPTGDHCTGLGYKTEIDTAAESGDGTITVDDDTNITNGDVIGIELDGGTIQWTTVNGVPAGDVVTLTDVLTDDAAMYNHVYNYTSKIQRPLEIIEARVVRRDGYETPLKIVSRDEYMRLPNKDSMGSALQIYYDPLLTNGKMWVWQACADVREYIKFTAKIPIEDFDAATDDPDFPQEWLMALSWNLATLIAPKFGKPLDDKFDLRAIAFKKNVVDFDREHTSIFLGLE